MRPKHKLSPGSRPIYKTFGTSSALRSSKPTCLLSPYIASPDALTNLTNVPHLHPIMNLYLALSLPILLGTLWIYTAHVVNTSLPRLINKRICLLIAHPDDEAMFFSPTVLALTAPERGNHLKILCLSSGALAKLPLTLRRDRADTDIDQGP